ncbi:MAG: SMC family ATPase, partial [Pirellulaceae bacterium]
MIPVRIHLSGFLCYREPREACFRGRTLWMLTGPNGSGKSALFDAVTYALFGQHRGGKQNARGLIHHDRDDLAVEFDFKVDRELFRAHRTLSRQGRSTRQILSAREDAPNTQWTPVPGTDTERGFAQWVNDHVALSYETFTTSILLLQGRAESLLLATPTERRRLLCQIVGLDRIEELVKRARSHLAESEGAAKSCRQQTRQLAAVETSRLDRLRHLVAAAHEQVIRHAARVEQLSETLAHATRYHQLTADIEQLRVELGRLEEELQIRQRQEAEQLDRAELAAHRDALKHLLDSRERVDQCQADIARLEAQHRTAQASLEQHEA